MSENKVTLPSGVLVDVVHFQQTGKLALRLQRPGRFPNEYTSLGELISNSEPQEVLAVLDAIRARVEAISSANTCAASLVSDAAVLR